MIYDMFIPNLYIFLINFTIKINIFIYIFQRYELEVPEKLVEGNKKP